MNRPASSASSPIDIASLLAEFDASGMNASAFARSRGLPAWRIYDALNRRKARVEVASARAGAAAPALLPVHVVPEPSAARAEPSLVLEIASGHRLRIGADFDAVLLRRVLGALSRC
jgi:hypothetical protein